MLQSSTFKQATELKSDKYKPVIKVLDNLDSGLLNAFSLLFTAGLEWYDFYLDFMSFLKKLNPAELTGISETDETELSYFEVKLENDNLITNQYSAADQEVQKEIETENIISE